MGEEHMTEMEARIIREMREMGVEASRLPDEKLPQGRMRVTFFGEARKLPEPGSPIEVRVEDGSWRGGFRIASGPSTHEDFPNERVVWITSDEEWSSAAAEDRPAARQPRPAEQMRAV
jgi:hypothetical protein